MFLFSFPYVDFDSNQTLEIVHLSIEIVYLMSFPRQATNSLNKKDVFIFFLQCAKHIPDKS